jgi:hypothetical protein
MNTPDSQSSTRAPAPESGRESYEPPSVIRLGSFHELTATVKGTGGTDTGGASQQ